MLDGTVDEIGFSDLSDRAYRIAPRVNATLTAVPPPGTEAADPRAPPLGRIFLFGGDDGSSSARGDMWVYDIGAGRWDETEGVRGDRPSARSRHTFTLVRCHREETQLEEDRLYLWGGVGQQAGEVVYLDLLRSTWVVPRTIGEHPTPLLGHTAAQVRDAWLHTTLTLFRRVRCCDDSSTLYKCQLLYEALCVLSSRPASRPASSLPLGGDSRALLPALGP